MKVLVNLLVICISVIFLPQESYAKNDIHPQGDIFPLGLYSIRAHSDLQKVTPFGWNLAQSYKFKGDLLHTYSKNNMKVLASLPEEYGANQNLLVSQKIKEYSKSSAISWWNLPEEMRWWRKKEMGIVKGYSKLTRKFDPKKRPNYMYIPAITV